ncbi:MAG TPA: DUF1844 domain-containing protein [Gammaproteobacteria bacterium]|nr:DUF1844 domain-containing protein [Gammaproteobacteria bacterium]
MADQDEKQEGKGFTVQDRRRFSPETGEAREDAPEAPSAAPAETEPSAAASAAESESTAASEKAQEPLPEINFSTFVISLSTQALMHLGEIADPLSGKVSKDIPVAKQMIDIIGMLKDKTKGNLNAGEERLMEEILFDLRMKYVEAVKKK